MRKRKKWQGSDQRDDKKRKTKEKKSKACLDD